MKTLIGVTFCDFKLCNSNFAVTSLCNLWLKAKLSYKLIKVILKALDSNLLVLCKWMDDGKVSLHRQGQGGPYGANLEYLKVWKLSFHRHIPHICYGRHGRRPCKFFLPGVNLYRFNAKNWQFTVYFAVITQKIGNLLCNLA